MAEKSGSQITRRYHYPVMYDIFVGKKIDDSFYKHLASEIEAEINHELLDNPTIKFETSWTRSVQEEDDGLVSYVGITVKADKEAFLNSWLSQYNGIFTPEDFQEKLVNELDKYNFGKAVFHKEGCVVQNPYDNSDHNLMVQLAFTLSDGKDDSGKED